MAKSSKGIGPAMDSPGRYRPAKERMGGPFEDYEVREALRTLSDAAKIRKNKALMRAVKKEAQTQSKAAAATAASITQGD